MRRNGYEAYSELDFKPITHDGCDSYARTLVRLGEVYPSIEFIES